MDTTGNIMVDIADGIGMVSKVWIIQSTRIWQNLHSPWQGIEALEFWLDPDQSSQSEPAQADSPASVSAAHQAQGSTRNF